MVTIFTHTDRIMLKQMIDNAAAGYYSAAVSCAGITGFVINAIIDSFRPPIFEANKTNQDRFEKKCYNALQYGYIFLLNSKYSNCRIFWLYCSNHLWRGIPDCCACSQNSYLVCYIRVLGNCQKYLDARQKQARCIMDH